jgi:hypothetical protein
MQSLRYDNKFEELLSQILTPAVPVRPGREQRRGVSQYKNNLEEIIMKVIGCIIIMMIPCLMYAESPVLEQEIEQHHVYIERSPVQAVPHIIHAFLDIDPLSADNETHWHYYILHSESAKQHVLTAFLSRLQSFHKHTKLPFKAVADYWKEMFDASTQIYVFQDNTACTQEFCTSVTCEKIVEASHILGLGFIWNGALCVAEEDIKDILDVPSEFTLVTTIFLPRAEKQEVSRARE